VFDTGSSTWCAATTSACASRIARYADLKLGFIDAAIVAIAERLRERRLATLDRRHFETIRPATSTPSSCCPGDTKTCLTLPAGGECHTFGANAH